jgi:glycosyltransferase involved in cell wall biosynthesis
MTDSRATRRPALIVNSMAQAKSSSPALGETGYSYEFVLRAFLPLLELYGEVTRIARPESQVDFAIRRLTGRGCEPFHLSFRPFSHVYLTRNAPNAVFPFWEFPDIPSSDYKDNPRNNWVRIAHQASLILTASNFTASALARAGVKTPVRVVPVPVSPACFDVPDWCRGQTVAIDCPAYVLTLPEVPVLHAPDLEARPGNNSLAFRLKTQLKSLARRAWVDGIKPHLPLRLSKAIVAAKNAGKRAWQEGETELPLAAIRLELSGIVYTSILNPDDKRKNWQDLVTAFLLALGDRDDATLVLKLAASYLAPVRELLAFYNKLGVPHRARIVLVTEYLNDAQMRELIRASTYYVNASRAEGACLPLQDYLAAGRPGIAPANTAMTDYFDAWVGYVVDSHAEPCPWPQDDTGRLHTTWHRIVWSSLRDQFAASYQAAKSDAETYQQLAAQARLRMKSWASADAVWPRLRDALDLLKSDHVATEIRRAAA